MDNISNIAALWLIIVYMIVFVTDNILLFVPSQFMVSVCLFETVWLTDFNLK